jgi:hypothetical protein
MENNKGRQLGRTQRSPKHAMNDPIRVHDLQIGWQNHAYARIDDASGRTLLGLFTITEVDAVIAALQTTRNHMQHNYDTNAAAFAKIMGSN